MIMKKKKKWMILYIKPKKKMHIMKNNQDDELFDKCIFYQKMMYKKVFLFLKINILNFIYISNQMQTQDKNNNINNSFKVFLRSLLQKEKLKDKYYIAFIENIEQFFNVQKERVFNLHKDINIDEKTIQYFSFLYKLFIQWILANFGNFNFRKKSKLENKIPMHENIRKIHKYL